MKKIFLLFTLITTFFVQAQNPIPTPVATQDWNVHIDMQNLGIYNADIYNAKFEEISTAQRDAISFPKKGRIILNSDTNAYNYFDGTLWQTFAGVNGDLQVTTDLGNVTTNSMTINSDGTKEYKVLKDGGDEWTYQRYNEYYWEGIGIEASHSLRFDKVLKPTIHYWSATDGTIPMSVNGILADEFSGNITLDTGVVSLTAGTGISITGSPQFPVINTVGGLSGSILNDQVAVGNESGAIEGDFGFTFDSAATTLSVNNTNVGIINIGASQLIADPSTFFINSNQLISVNALAGFELNADGNDVIFSNAALTTFSSEVELSSYGIGSWLNTPTYALGVNGVGSIVEFPVAPVLAKSITADTGTVVDVSNVLGNECNMLASNASTTYTTTGTDGWAKILIDASTEPIVTGATKEIGAEFLVDQEQYLIIYHDASGYKYFFRDFEVTTSAPTYTGWADYVDSQYTIGSPLVVLASTPAILQNNASSIVDFQKPIDINTFYYSRNITLTGVTGTFVLGEILTGGTSGATGTIADIIGLDLYLVNTSNVEFSDTETVTGGTSSATATVSGTPDPFGGITGRNGDGITITVEFTATPTNANTSYIEVYYDITGTTGTPTVLANLYKRIITFPKGQGNPRPISFSVTGYTLATWEANGAHIIVESDNTCDIYDIRYVLTRSHKAN